MFTVTSKNVLVRVDLLLTTESVKHMTSPQNQVPLFDGFRETISKQSLR